MSRSRTSKAWIHEHLTDSYVKRAKREGYRSRAAYKLLGIDAKERFLSNSACVIDLGSAPGGWSQVVAQRAAPGALVIAVDLLEMDPIQGVNFIQGDFADALVAGEIEQLKAGRSVDLVLCDVSPNISGIASVDQARAYGLAEVALTFARDWLQPQGVFLVKVFQGAEFGGFRQAMRQGFREVRVHKPAASRERSSEVYLLGRGPLTTQE